ncbi:MAG: NAD(P)-binding domain-containing protein [Candidatus Eiseniibacteriota bacterium]
MNALARYALWLHTGWPAGTVEKLPALDPQGRTNVPGVYVVGDLTGIPLLKLSSDSGARAIAHIADDPAFQAARNRARDRAGGADEPLDVLIVGGGVSGFAAALEAGRRGLRFVVLEAGEPFSTIENFPRAKPIFTYPEAFTPSGSLRISADIKEALVEELTSQTLGRGLHAEEGRALAVRRRGELLEVERAGGSPLVARRVVLALGRSGNHRRLGIPGEEKFSKVFNRLHDPADFKGRDVLVVGGGDSAVETAIALSGAGARVTLAHRGPDLPRAKASNVVRLHALAAESSTRPVLRLQTRVRAIGDRDVVLIGNDGADEVVPNDVVFVMIGRDAPLDFFRRSGVRLRGEITRGSWIAFGAFLVLCAALYNWKSGGVLDRLAREAAAFPYSLANVAAAWAPDPHSLLGVTLLSAQSPSFWYTVAYSILVVVFGIRRIRRRRTPYVTLQTWTLMAIQVLPLFLLPEIVLPWMSYHGLLPQAFADAFFPTVAYGHGREFWRAYGFVLAWPLNVYNLFTDRPLWAWIGIGIAQTLIAIPLLVLWFGKGAYCGWICSCGALAETLGDGQREKMPHGPFWNRLNLLGQAILAIAVVLLVVRIVGWTQPPDAPLNLWFGRVALQHYKWTVDVFLAGVLGYGAYYWFSGRTWCRFACPLAAWMHVVARFSRFRIFAEKKKCISCNVCTSVCHQGIDVMSFANKGLPMNDPQCVRCSACVSSCPTGVLTFGRIDSRTGRPAALDRLAASPVQLRESR